MVNYLFYSGPWRKPQYCLSLSSSRKGPSNILRLCWRAVEEPLSRVVSYSYRAPDMGWGDWQPGATVYQFCTECCNCKSQLEVSSDFFFCRMGRGKRNILRSFLLFFPTIKADYMLITTVIEQKDTGMGTIMKSESLVLLLFQFKV